MTKIEKFENIRKIRKKSKIRKKMDDNEKGRKIKMDNFTI